MVFDGMSTQFIRNYLHRWALWWVNTTESWTYEELMRWFCAVCWEKTAAAYAAGLLGRHLTQSRTNSPVLGACA